MANKAPKKAPKVGRCKWCGYWGVLVGKWCGHPFNPRRVSDCQKAWRKWVWEKNQVVRPFYPTRQWIELGGHRCRGLSEPIDRCPMPINCGRMKKRILPKDYDAWALADE